MKCSNCSNKLAKDWFYCPYCGNKASPEVSFFNGIEKLVSNLTNGTSIPIGRVTIKVKTSPESINHKPKLSIKLPKNVVEPRTEVKRIGKYMDVIINLPGIKSLSNIDLNCLGESLEVRAASKSKGFFKVISIPDYYKIMGKKLSNEVLSIKLGERRAE